MGKFEEYLEKARDLAGDAGDKAKDIAGDVVSKARKLTDDGGKVREFAQNAKEQTAAFTLGAKEKVQGVLQDVRAGRELKQGISELQALPEIEGSIIYKMEHESMINYLNSLLLIISDGRLDDASVIEEITRVIDKVQPAADLQPEELLQEKTEEEQAIEKVRSITYSACTKALEAIKNVRE